MKNRESKNQQFPRRALHVDFHTMPGIRDVGCDFDRGVFVDMLKGAGIQYVTVFARCNLGFAYYPTKLGTIHPSLQRDLLGEMVQACKESDIDVAAYFNAGLDHQHALEHREWCKVNKSGSVYDIPNMGHYFRTMCLNSGYGDHLLAMAGEMLDAYPVDGIFMDCFTMTPCYGYECLEAMRRVGMDPSDDSQVLNYTWKVNSDFRGRVNHLVDGYKRGLRLYLNGLPYRWQSSHLELEVLPTGGWGYDVLPWQVRYARTLEKPFFTMTARFHGGWGDFGGLRSRDGLLFDLYNSIANGGTCSIGDHMHPRGALEPAVYKLIADVYEEVSRLEPWLADRRAEADIVIVDPKLQRLPGDLSVETGGVAGATRMLSELKYQFDVSDSLSDLTGYKVIVLPDNVLVDDELKAKLQNHLTRGGVIVSSASAGLNPDKTAFSLAEYAMDYEGPEEHDPTFIVADDAVSEGVPAMPITVFSPGVAVRPKAGAQALGRLMKSYFNRQTWDGFHENMYMPPDAVLDRPSIVQSQKIVHFSFPIFSGYFENAVVAYKQLFANCLTRVFSETSIKVEGLPSFAQVTRTENAASTQVHLLTYLPELRGKQMQVIEEPIVVRDVRVSLKCEQSHYADVFLAPSREALEFTYKEGYIEVNVPKVHGYQMVVFARQQAL